jgi:hypothetical protein
MSEDLSVGDRLRWYALRVAELEAELAQLRVHASDLHNEVIRMRYPASPEGGVREPPE